MYTEYGVVLMTLHIKKTQKVYKGKKYDVGQVKYDCNINKSNSRGFHLYQNYIKSN